MAFYNAEFKLLSDERGYLQQRSKSKQAQIWWCRSNCPVSFYNRLRPILGSILGSLFSFQCNTLYLHLYWVGGKKPKFLAWGRMSRLKAKYFLVYLPHPNLGNKHFTIKYYCCFFPFLFFFFFFFLLGQFTGLCGPHFEIFLFCCFSFKVIVLKMPWNKWILFSFRVLKWFSKNITFLFLAMNFKNTCTQILHRVAMPQALSIFWLTGICLSIVSFFFDSVYEAGWKGTGQWCHLDTAREFPWTKLCLLLNNAVELNGNWWEITLR